MTSKATLSRFPLLRSRAHVSLMLGLLGLTAWAASPPIGASLAADRFSQACAALEAGDLDSAAQEVRALRETSPEAPEARLLESLLTLRREQPSLDGFKAFLQAWNSIGRPDFSDSELLPQQGFTEPSDTEKTGLHTASSEDELVLTLNLTPNASRGRLVLRHLRELEPPELIFAAAYFLHHESLPKTLRAEASQALRARLYELTVAAPRAMQYPALLLVDGSSPTDPFTSEDVQALEAIATLPDWRETDFHTLYLRTLRQFKAAGHSQPTQAAFQLAVMSLANEPAYLIFSRAEASRATLSAADLQRLGDAMWGIGSRMAEESTVLELMMGTRMMQDGASLAGNETRRQQATTLREQGAAAMRAMSRAAPHRWPLRSVLEPFLDAQMRNELGCMRQFLPQAGE